MKIAVCSSENKVSQHFGHCETFQIFTVENQTITDETNVSNPGHQPGFLPNYLGDLGVNTVIAGGMGEGATEIFRKRNIEVITGASGDARSAAVAYLQGTLKSTGAACHEHQHAGHCNE